MTGKQAFDAYVAQWTIASSGRCFPSRFAADESTCAFGMVIGSEVPVA